MSAKFTCPACGATSSRHQAAYDNSEPCPDCALPADVARQIMSIRESRATDDARRAAEQALIRAGEAEASARTAAWRIEQVTQALGSEPPEWWQPDLRAVAMQSRPPATRLRFLAKQLSPDDGAPDPTAIMAVAMALRTLAAESEATEG